MMKVMVVVTLQVLMMMGVVSAGGGLDERHDQDP